MIKITNAIFALTLSSALLAEKPEPCEPYCEPCRPAPDPCAKCAQIWPTCGPDWIITPNAGPCVANGFDANITLSFIYWTTREDNLGFACRESIQQVGNEVTITSKSHTKHPDWNFRPGFKMAVGYLYDHDGWDIEAEYTWLRVRNTKESVSADDLNTQRIVGIWPLSIPLENPTRAEAFWQLDFNVIDVELGRNFFISRYLKLRPHFGLKGTWQDQHYQVDATGFTNDVPSLSRDRHCLDYWGVGIRAGLDTAWHFNRCFSLVGEIAFAGLWERFKAEEKVDEAPLVVGAAAPLTLLNVENNIRTIKPVIEFYLGLRWETWFCCEHYHFSIEGAWEEQWWSNQNQFIDAFQEARLGDLSLHGFTLKARIDF